MSNIKEKLLHLIYGNSLFRKMVRFGKLSYIREHAIIRRNKGTIKLGYNTKILSNSRIQCIDSNSSITIGDDCYICYRFSCLCKEKIDIGNHVLIASDVFITDYNHSTDRNLGFNMLVAKPIKIGNNCWIGEKSIILPGVIIGNGCVIGAGSVVTKSVPENTMVAGNPAKVIKKYNDSTNKWEKITV